VLFFSTGGSPAFIELSSDPVYRVARIGHGNVDSSMGTDDLALLDESRLANVFDDVTMLSWTLPYVVQVHRLQVVLHPTAVFVDGADNVTAVIGVYAATNHSAPYLFTATTFVHRVVVPVVDGSAPSTYYVSFAVEPPQPESFSPGDRLMLITAIDATPGTIVGSATMNAGIGASLLVDEG
jgi:hypothetical protein